MEQEQFVEMFKKALKDGDIKLNVERERYCGDVSLTVSITDKEGQTLAEDFAYIE